METLLMRPIIFVDMDDVIVNFHDACMAVHGKTKPTQEEWPKGNYDMPTVLNITNAQFKKPLNELFYTALPIAPYAKLLLEMLETKGNVCILTSLYKYDTPKGKLLWLNNYLPWYLDRNKIVMAYDKSYCASPHAILIDDCDNHVKGFLEAGGLGITFPQPWNHNHKIVSDGAKCCYVIEQVNSIIESMIE